MLGTILTLVVVANIYLWIISHFALRRLREIRDGQRELTKMLRSIEEQLTNLVEGRRLSTVLNLSPASLRIDPERFEANKAELRARILATLDYRWDVRDIPNGAALVLDESGWRNFVTYETAEGARRVLIRLMTNRDKETAKAFCEELVDKL